MSILKPSEKAFWENYLSNALPTQKPENIFVEASQAGNIDITNDLIDLFLQGKKKAGSSLKADFLSENIALPKVNNYWIVLNDKLEPKCILKTINVVENKFKDVPIEIAIAEGEGDLSLEYWRKVHRSFFIPFLDEWGVQNLDNAIVITEYFELVYSG